MAAEIKVEKDVEAVREIIKQIGTIEGDVEQVKVEWKTYTSTIKDKEYGSDQIGNILNELFDKKYRYDPSSSSLNFEEIDTADATSGSLKKGLVIKIPDNPPNPQNKNISNGDDIINFKRFFETLVKELNKDENKSPYQNTLNKPDFVDINTKINTQSTDADNRYETVVQFLNEVKGINTTNSSNTTYSEEEKKQARQYFSENKTKPLLGDLEKTIVAKTNDCVSKLIEIASRYSGLDARIKKDVLENLKPTNISNKSKVEIVEHINKLVLNFIQDYNTKYNKIPRGQQGGGGRKKKKIGGVDTVSPSKSENPRIVVEDIFAKKIFQNIQLLKKIAEDLYKGLNRFSNPEMGDTSKGEDSIFNKLFEKYMKTKDDTEKGGPFVASTELINDLKSNDLYPEEVLKIDMRDKFVFIATTLFMRIITLMIIDTIIDRKMITRMDTAIFWYGIITTIFLTVFVLLVNFDSYKLRIVFNYVNFHIGYSTTFSYIFQLWLFGGMVYYIMLKINDDVISSATNDEDRARLKHKVQVISMITWFFLSLGVLLM